MALSWFSGRATSEGWIAGALEMDGGKNVVVEQDECIWRNGAACVYRITWSPQP